MSPLSQFVRLRPEVADLDWERIRGHILFKELNKMLQPRGLNPEAFVEANLLRFSGPLDAHRGWNLQQGAADVGAAGEGCGRGSGFTALQRLRELMVLRLSQNPRAWVVFVLRNADLTQRELPRTVELVRGRERMALHPTFPTSRWRMEETANGKWYLRVGGLGS